MDEKYDPGFGTKIAWGLGIVICLFFWGLKQAVMYFLPPA